MARVGRSNTPIFQDGDLMYDGVIIRKVPEISTYVSNMSGDLVERGRLGPVRAGVPVRSTGGNEWPWPDGEADLPQGR
jgi:hypothetical protein